MSAPFTPGPWRVVTTERPSKGGYWREIKGGTSEEYADDTVIGEVFDDDDKMPNAEADANANLIAAAPELYEALAQCVLKLRTCAELLENAEWAIDGLCAPYEGALAKARGQ